MDNAELTRWRTLANDAVIATFGQDSREAWLAVALERAVEAVGDFDAAIEKVDALEEDNDALRADVEELRNTLRAIQKSLDIACKKVAAEVGELKLEK